MSLRFVSGVLFCVAFACVARAETPSVASCVDRLDDAQVNEALAFTESSLRAQRLGASLWFSGWTAFNVVNVSVGVWKTIDAPTRLAHDTWLVSTIGAGLFIVGASALPLPGLYANLRLSRLPATTAEQKRAKLRRGLSLLESAAQSEERNSNWTAHVGGLVFAVGSTGYVYLHNMHERGRSLALATGLQFISTVIGAEATLWSVPRRARRDLAKLQAGVCTPASTHPPKPPTERKLTLGVGAGFVRFGWSF